MGREQDGGSGLWGGMVDVICQGEVSGTRALLGLRLRFWKAVRAGYWYVWTDGPYLVLGQLCNSVAGLQ